MDKTQERLAVIKLAEVVADFPFLEPYINPLIARLITKGEVTHDIVEVGINEGRTEAIYAFRERYFRNSISFTEAKEAIDNYFQQNNLEFGPKKLDNQEN